MKMSVYDGLYTRCSTAMVAATATATANLATRKMAAGASAIEQASCNKVQTRTRPPPWHQSWSLASTCIMTCGTEAETGYTVEVPAETGWR